MEPLDTTRTTSASASILCLRGGKVTDTDGSTTIPRFMPDQRSTSSSKQLHFSNRATNEPRFSKLGLPFLVFGLRADSKRALTISHFSGDAGTPLFQLSMEPRFGDTPIAFDGFWRDAQHCGRLLHGQA